MIRFKPECIFFLLTVFSVQGIIYAQNNSAVQLKRIQDQRADRIKEHQDLARDLVENSRKREIDKRKVEAEKKNAADRYRTLYSNNATIDRSINQEQKIFNSNWQQFWDFYYQPDLKEVKLSGQEQSYSNDSIVLNWTIPDTDKASTGPASMTGHLKYQWLKGSMASDVSNELSFPKEPGDLFLRSGENCLRFSYGSFGTNEVEISQWIQPKDWKIASAITAPKPSLGQLNHSKTFSSYDITVTPVDDQLVNDWNLFIKDGSVFAYNRNSNETLIIGNKNGDYRPVGLMNVAIRSTDPLTRSFYLKIDEARYPQSIFATGFYLTGENVASLIKPEMSIADAIDKVATHFGFSVEWDGDEAANLARNRQFRKATGSADGAILYGIDKGMGDDFVAEVLTSTSLRISLSYKYKQEKEKVEFQKRLASEFAFETKLYSTNRLTADTAAKLIEDQLHCYVIDVVAKDGMTSSPIVVKGQYNSITAHPLDWRGSKQGPHVKCESVIADGETNTIVVKAKADTHAKIAAWLQEIDGSSKASALGTNEAIPERRRLQIVLLQGGKSGAAAFGTSTTYSASVPAQYGMTPEDLKVMGFDGAVELGRGLVEVVANPGDMGKSTLQLAKRYPIKLSYLDERSPYLIIQAQILDAESKALAENTMMLEKGKAGYLGVTNLSGAVIAVVTWLDDDHASN